MKYVTGTLEITGYPVPVTITAPSATKVYDGKKWIIKKTPKTDKSNRVIPLSDELVSEMKQYGFTFDASPKLLNTELHRACKALGIPAFRFHDLRHTYATLALEQGK